MLHLYRYRISMYRCRAASNNKRARSYATLKFQNFFQFISKLCAYNSFTQSHTLATCNATMTAHCVGIQWSAHVVQSNIRQVSHYRDHACLCHINYLLLLPMRDECRSEEGRTRQLQHVHISYKLTREIVMSATTVQP